MRKEFKRIAASAMSFCLLASAFPAAMPAQAVDYPGDSALSTVGTPFTSVKDGQKYVTCAYDYNKKQTWMLNKSKNIRVITDGKYDPSDVRKPFEPPTAENRTPLLRNSSWWNTKAEMMYNTEKVYDFYQRTLGHYNFNFSGASNPALYVFEFKNPGDARSDVWIHNSPKCADEPINFLAFGSADSTFNNMAVDIGVVGHEFTHLVAYQKVKWYPNVMDVETEAIMEAYCDILGELIEPEPDWKVGADIFKYNTQNHTKKYSLRDMKNPSATNNPQVTTQIKYYSNYTDFKNNLDWLRTEPYPYKSCYVGTTVLDRAAYLMYTAGKNAGISQTDLAKIWYYSLDNFNYYTGDATKATFLDCRAAVVKAAQNYFNNDVAKIRVIEKAFDDVKICYQTAPSQQMAANANYMADFVRAESRKLPSGRYWNTGNPDKTSEYGWLDDTSTYMLMGPTAYPDFWTCYWQYDEPYYQCAGFAKKLQVDYFGTNTFVQNSNVNYTPQIGDHLRVDQYYKGSSMNSSHSVFITGVNGSTITFADCNKDNKCGIRWALNATFTRDSSGRLSYQRDGYEWRFSWVERPLKKGDVNADGLVDSKDRTVMSNLLKGNLSNSMRDVYLRHLAADINGDGKVNSTDSTLLTQLVNNTNGARNKYGCVLY
ncbi:MAG: M4 family metallopeptidase [Acutalibacteraceae bacterium]|nr:M4 family metallopeptidase [Acutalibacteraceae bacterium]